MSYSFIQTSVFVRAYFSSGGGEKWVSFKFVASSSQVAIKRETSSLLSDVSLFERQLLAL